MCAALPGELTTKEFGEVFVVAIHRCEQGKGNGDQARAERPGPRDADLGRNGLQVRL